MMRGIVRGMSAALAAMVAVGLALLAAIGGPAQAQSPPDFVTDLALCPLELGARQEKGTSFDGSDFWEIEYHCGLERPIERPDWTNSRTQIRTGYCEEPGFLYPTIFVFRTHPSEPGVLTVWEGDAGEGTRYFLCP